MKNKKHGSYLVKHNPLDSSMVIYFVDSNAAKNLNTKRIDCHQNHDEYPRDVFSLKVMKIADK